MWLARAAANVTDRSLPLPPFDDCFRCPTPVASLHVGDEIDYLAVDDVWVPARVESISANGCVLRLRFCGGDADVAVHSVDLRRSRDSWRVAPAGAELATRGHIVEVARVRGMALPRSSPTDAAIPPATLVHAAVRMLPFAGMKSVPLLPQQPVDVLRRTTATAALGASEQWLRGASAAKGAGVHLTPERAAGVNPSPLPPDAPPSPHVQARCSWRRDPAAAPTRPTCPSA